LSARVPKCQKIKKVG